MKLFKPSLPLRRSVLLISTAILMSAIAQAQTKSASTSSAGINIGRLPSFHAGDGQVVGAKPNVFIIVDNTEDMTGSKRMSHADPNGNYLQQTAGALIAALPQLEGKVRLGYTTVHKGTYAIDGFKSFGGLPSHQKTCKYFKLNGNVDRLDRYIPGLKDDLAKNPNYVTGKEDFVFNDSGAGYGNTVPRDFRDNYARYIYAWLGAMCMGNTSNRDNIPYNKPPTSNGVPPYADLRDPAAYKAAATAAKNKNSYPIVNFIGTNIPKKTHKPLIDMYARVLGQVSDENFICGLQQGNSGGSKCIYTDLSAERGSSGGVTLRNYPENNVWKYFSYDAYAPARPDTGFPDDKNPLSCRKNYTIMISQGAYGQPSDKLRSNTNVGVGSWGIDGKGTAYGIGWRLPNGRDFPRSGYLGEITRMYRFLPIDGTSEIRAIPKSSYVENNKTYYLQGAGGKFLLSKMILQSYYMDLRSNLLNDVPSYIAGPTRRDGPDGKAIPPFWDRKNDTASWQHMAFFALGFTDEKESSFATWQRANKAYKPYFSNLDPEGGLLEPYFRAVEGGKIYEENQPLPDWGRGGYGLKSLPMSYYFYTPPQTQAKEQLKIGPDQFQGSKNLEAWGEALDMDYAKAGIIGRGGAYEITDYNSIKKVISMIANRIETAMAQGISGGAISGGGRVTASQQAAGGNDSILFTTYLDQETASGNIFAFKNCPLIKQKIPDGHGGIKDNPDWNKYNCGKRLWNAASTLYDSVDSLSSKTIIPVENGGELSGTSFDWSNLDQKLKTELSRGGDETLGKARVEWLNGKLQSQLDPAVANKLRTRGEIFIPDEKQNYKRKPDGSLEKDPDGNVIIADPTNIPNLMGDVVYALPKAVDNRSTLPAAHPLYNQSYIDFLNTTVKNRKPLVLAGSNDGRLYGFSVAKTGKTADESENAALAFSYIPRQVITKTGDNLASYTTEAGLNSIKSGLADGLLNGPFTVRDAQVNGKWGTYVVGTLGEGGDAIYALDISNGRADPNMFKWEVSGRGYGNIMAEPRIIWLRARSSINTEPKGKWVVVLPTGYNADSVSLIVLDLADGTELAKINTTAKYSEIGEKNGTKTCQLVALNSNEANNADVKALWDKLSNIGEISVPKELTCDNGLGQLTVFDADSDSGADFVFAGDLLGHIWKFDLSGFFDSTGNQLSDLNNALKVAYNSPLFIAQTPIKPNKISTRQPITSMITIDDGAYGEGSMLYFGTGRMLNQKERQLKQQESFYGIWDIPRYSEQKNISLPLRRNPILAKGAKYDFIRYETFVIPSSDVVDKQHSSLKNFKELRGVKRIDHLTSSKYLSFNLKGQHNLDDKVFGWIIDFPSEDALERVINRAYSFEDNIFFPTFSPKSGSTDESCSPIRSGVGGDARFYMVDRLTGGQLDTSPFDFNNDGTQDDQDGVKVSPEDLGNATYDNKKPVDDCKSNPASCKLPLSPAGILIGSGGGDFLSVTGILERSKQATNKYNCDYSRQVVFPSTVDPVTGNPLILSSCNRNRYRVWKQPVIE